MKEVVLHNIPVALFNHNPVGIPKRVDGDLAVSDWWGKIRKRSLLGGGGGISRVLQNF